ncbi:flagellar protein FlgA [soil metagenome]
MGVGLVIASVAGVVAIVGATDQRVTVYAAAQTLAPGDRVAADDLIARRVSLDDAASLYLAAGDLPDAGLAATTVIRRGELVPRSAVGTEQGRDSTAIVLRLAGAVSESIIAGAAVDIWSSTSASGDADMPGLGGFGPPIVLSSDAIVVRVIEADGIVSAGDGQSVEVLVPRSRIARLLQAIANGDALAVVPAGIPLAVP